MAGSSSTSAGRSRWPRPPRHIATSNRANRRASWCCCRDDDGVVVVDSHSKPSAARALYKEIQGITNKPVRKLVNTHFHFDHWQGNQIYAEGNPGLEVVATQRTRENLTRPDAGLGGIPFVEKAGHHAAPGRDPEAEGRCHARQQSGDEGPPRVEPPAGRGVLPGAQELQADAADANGVLDDHAPGGRT